MTARAATDDEANASDATDEGAGYDEGTATDEGAASEDGPASDGDVTGDGRETTALEDATRYAARFSDRDVRRLGLGAVALFAGTALGVAFGAPVPGIALAALGALALASTVHARRD